MDLVGRYSFNEEDHLHALDGKPLTGTSSVMEIIAKPLTWWAVGEGLKTLGWTPIREYVNGKPVAVPRHLRVAAASDGHRNVLEMDQDQFLKALDEAYYAHSKTKDKAATKGKNLHKSLEKYVKYSLAKNAGAPANIVDADIQQFVEWSINNVEKFLASEMHTFSEKHWLGGITDAVALLKDGRTAIIDFKSSKAAYPNQFWQIGGYDIQIGENGGFDSKGNHILDARLADVHMVIPFGAPEFIVVEDRDTVANRNSYLSALHLYRENKRLSGE